MADRMRSREIQDFPPHILREYSLLADGQRGVIVGPRGDFAWMCLPSWDGGSVFSSLAGGPGVYAVTPRDPYVWGGFYEEGSLIWNSRWITENNAIIECREALAMPAGPDKAVLLRRITALTETARVHVVLDVRTDYGKHGLRDVHRGNDIWHARAGDWHVTWAPWTKVHARDMDGATVLSADIDLEQGQRHDLVLVLSKDETDVPDADVTWQETEDAWRDAVPPFGDSLAPRDCRHAYAVLHGLTGPSGGTVAAATTSLPERAEQGRNYDYRYVWMRDLSYIGHAIAAAGGAPLLDGVVRFTTERLLADGPRLRPAYTASGGVVPEESQLDLPGYPGGCDRIGNRVTSQFQLDVFGEALVVLADAARLDRLGPEGWKAATVAVEAITKRWREADSGIWELEPRRWTHSRLSCAAGLRVIARCAPAAEAAGWLSLADSLVADVSVTGVHPSGRWQRADDDDRVDAALLLPGLRGGLRPDDPRVIATLEAVQEELTQDGYVYRFRPDARPLGEAEGAFLLCGFFLCLALHAHGDTVAAVRCFERHRAACGPPGLYSEEYDVTQRQLRSNLPQAFVHALLIESAVTLGRPFKDISIP